MLTLIIIISWDNNNYYIYISLYYIIYYNIYIFKCQKVTLNSYTQSFDLDCRSELAHCFCRDVSVPGKYKSSRIIFLLLK